jgi:hypothetical protein
MTWDMLVFVPRKGWQLLCCTPDPQFAWAWFWRNTSRRRVRARFE